MRTKCQKSVCSGPRGWWYFRKKWEVGRKKWELSRKKWELSRKKWELSRKKWELSRKKWEGGRKENQNDADLILSSIFRVENKIFECFGMYFSRFGDAIFMLPCLVKPTGSKKNDLRKSRKKHI